MVMMIIQANQFQWAIERVLGNNSYEDWRETKEDTPTFHPFPYQSSTEMILI